uniref:Ubiquinol-cytochrome-c reductase complex assembly factor 3 n=2 Tax=Cynoglossus semilaevis TaxID=244447 RepID=A0A3P8VG69_CYNSE
MASVCINLHNTEKHQVCLFFCLVDGSTGHLTCTVQQRHGWFPRDGHGVLVGNVRPDSRMSGVRRIVSYAYMIVIVGAGLGTWALISPGEEKRKEQLKNLPGSKQTQEEAKRRNALVMQALKDAANINDNISRSSQRKPKVDKNTAV